MSYQYPVLEPNSFQFKSYQSPFNPILNLDPPNNKKFEEEPDEIKEIIHQINPCDTLFGVALQYDVPVERIKAYNNLYSNDIYYLKELRIPNAKTQMFPPYNDEDVMQTTQRQLLTYFSTLVRPEDSRDEKMLKYYLAEADYDVKIAFDEYEKDLKYEKEQKKLKKSSNPFKYMEFKKFN